HGPDGSPPAASRSRSACTGRERSKTRPQRGGHLGDPRSRGSPRQTHDDPSRDDLDRLRQSLLGRIAHPKGHECRSPRITIIRKRQQPLPDRATPLRQLLRRHPVSLRHLTDPDTWRQALPYDPRLDLVRPSASSSTAGHHFHPASEAVPPRCLRYLHRQPPAVKERPDWMAGGSYKTESSMGVKPRLP